jgi:hypothetical protein
MSHDGENLNEIRRLARSQPGDNGDQKAKPKRRVATSVSNGTPAGIREILNTPSDTLTRETGKTLSGHATPASAGVDDQESLRDVLKHQKGAARGEPARPPAGTQGDHASVREILGSAHSPARRGNRDHKPPRNQAAPAPATAQPSVSDALHAQRATASQPAKTPPSYRVNWPEGKYFWPMATLAGLLISILAIGKFQTPFTPSYPSALAKQVAMLADEVMAYQTENGKTPKLLSNLKGYPEGALEWPLEHYSVRLMESATEFFFYTGGPGGFVIIGRHGQERWIYLEGDDPPLQPFRG